MLSDLIQIAGDFRFYTECLGMKLLRKRDIPEERYTNAFLGYGPEDSHFVIELTYSKLSNNSSINKSLIEFKHFELCCVSYVEPRSFKKNVIYSVLSLSCQSFLCN